MSENTTSIDMSGVLEALKRRKIPFLVFFVSVFLVGLLLVSTLDSYYEAGSTVLVERPISSDLVSTTVTGKLQERLQVLQKRAFTDENLEMLAEASGYYEEMVLRNGGEAPSSLELVENFYESLGIETTDVKVTEDRGGRANSVVISFGVAFESTSPEVARKMANLITELLLQENRKLRNEQSNQVTTFLERAEQRLQENVFSIENDISQLKESEYEFLPDQVAESRREASKRREELIQVQGDISFLESQVAQLGQRLANTPRHLLGDRQSNAAMQDPAIRLQQARINLEVARQSFTDNHPDIIELRRLIAELEREVARGGGSSSDLTLATNPDYISISQQQTEAVAKLEGLKARKQQIESLLAGYESRSASSPEVELRYNQLLRDLERAQAEYSDIKSRLYEARLAETLEQEQKGERFVLLASASLPEEPVRPNRIAFFVLVLVFSLVSGGAAVFVAELRDDTVKSSRDLAAIAGSKPIGVIPVIDLTGL